MEKYIALILLTAPGFVAYSVSTYLSPAARAKTEFQAVMKYFTYSAFSLGVTLLLMPVLKGVEIERPWTEVYAFTSTAEVMSLLCLMLITSLIVGVGWPVIGHKLLLDACNWVNGKVHNPTKFTEPTVFHRAFFSDDKPHFVIVKKIGDENPVTVGFINKASEPDSDRVEYGIATYPEYWDEYTKKLLEGKSTPLRQVKYTYIDAANGIKITETEYPPEWFPTATNADGK